MSWNFWTELTSLLGWPSKQTTADKLRWGLSFSSLPFPFQGMSNHEKTSLIHWQTHCSLRRMCQDKSRAILDLSHKQPKGQFSWRATWKGDFCHSDLDKELGHGTLQGKRQQSWHETTLVHTELTLRLSFLASSASAHEVGVGLVTVFHHWPWPWHYVVTV